VLMGLDSTGVLVVCSGPRSDRGHKRGAGTLMTTPYGMIGPADTTPDGTDHTPRPWLTRWYAFVVIVATIGTMFVVATLAQIMGVWVWEPTLEAGAALGCLVAAALTATYYLPADES